MNPNARHMVLKTINLTFCRHIAVNETLKYVPHPSDSSKTLLKQEAVVTVQGQWVQYLVPVNNCRYLSIIYIDSCQQLLTFLFFRSAPHKLHGRSLNDKNLKQRRQRKASDGMGDQQDQRGSARPHQKYRRNSKSH